MERKEPRQEPPKNDSPENRFEAQAAHRKRRKKMFRWALAVAVVLHLAFLAWNIPALLADDPPPPEEEERAVFKIQDMQVKPPQPKPEPKPPEPEPEPPEEAPKKPAPKPEAKKVPAPDPTPQEPEPMPEPIPTPDREVDLTREPTAEPTLDTPEPTAPDVDEMEVDIPEPPPEPEPPEPEGPIRVGGDVKAPVRVAGDQPKYTPAARESRVEGIVVVQAVINKQGRVEEVKVLKDLPMGLSDRAAATIRDWRFEPATLNGKPVAVYYNLTVNFTLN